MSNYPERKARRENGAPMMSRQRPPWWLRDHETAQVVLYGPFYLLPKHGDARERPWKPRGK